MRVIVLCVGVTRTNLHARCVLVPPQFFLLFVLLERRCSRGEGGRERQAVSIPCSVDTSTCRHIAACLKRGDDENGNT